MLTAMLATSAVVSLASMLVMVIALRRCEGESKPTLCPICGYELRGMAAGTKCPECGQHPQHASEIRSAVVRRNQAVLAWAFAVLGVGSNLLLGEFDVGLALAGGLLNVIPIIVLLLGVRGGTTRSWWVEVGGVLAASAMHGFAWLVHLAGPEMDASRWFPLAYGTPLVCIVMAGISLFFRLKGHPKRC